MIMEKPGEESLSVTTSLRGEGRERLDQFIRFLEEQGPCDKCGKPVDSWNNAAVFDWINHLGTDWTSYFYANRHLEPVADEETGIVTCPGSPSRWQHVSALPDERPEYKKDLSTPQAQEDLYWGRRIWDFMQTLRPGKTSATKELMPRRQ